MGVLKEELNSTSTYVPAQLTKDKLILHHMDAITKWNIKIDKIDLPTFYRLPKLHKNPYKSSFISNSSFCSTTILSKHITSALTAVKDHVINLVKLPFEIVMWIILVHQKLFWGHRKVSAAKFSGFRVLRYLLSIFVLYIHPCLMILSKQRCCVLLNNVSIESQKRTSVHQTRRYFFSNKKYDSYACWTCTELCDSFTLLIEIIYVPFDGMI